MPKRIILIDDDVQLCEEVAEILRDEGYFVDNTSDEIRGEALIKDNTYDICLLDYKMQRLTGIELLKKIKEKNYQCEALIISGRPFIEKIIEEQNISHLVSGIIEKPFDIKLLLEKIKSLTQNPH